MRFTLARSVVKVLDRIDKPTEKHLRNRLEKLGENPYSARISKALVNEEGLRSSRVGNWRILHTLDDHDKVLYVLAIRPRGDVYRDL